MTIRRWRRSGSSSGCRRKPPFWIARGEILEARIALTGELTFAEPVLVPMGMNPEAMTVADLDGNGLMDLVTADFAGGAVTVRYGAGNGQFTGSRYHFVGQGPVDVVAADLDGRHGLDLITANMLTGDVSVLLSTGFRMFAEEARHQTGEFTSGVVVADINGDDLPDILVASTGVESIGKVSLLTGDPSDLGTFEPPLTILEKWGPNSVVAEYFDEDDSLDLAIASDAFGDNDIAVLLGTNGGGFAPAVSYEAGNSPDRMVAADLNSDGHIDLAVNNWFSGDVSIFLGRGNGTFDAAVSYAEGLASGSVTVADIDADGNPDLITTDGSSVSVLTGRGDGTFEVPVSFPLTGSPTDVAVADLNNDGRLDLAVCTQDPSAVEVLLSTAEQVVELKGAGDTYVQRFDEALGLDGDNSGTALPTGWTTIVQGQQLTQIVGSYPPQEVTADTFNAGVEGESDRTLALGNDGDGLLTQFQLQLSIVQQDVHGLTLYFDLEVWGGDPVLAANPGTVALDVSLQIDEGGGFVPLVDLGTVSTGPSLSPSDTVILNGNVAPNLVHFESGVIDAPIPAGAVLRLDFNVPDGDEGTGFIYGLDNVRIRTMLTGDANGDGLFNSSDLVQVFQAGEYEDDIPDNSTFAEGDWNADGEFDSSDMVMAFQSGLYEVAAKPRLSDIAAAIDAIFAEQHTPKSDDAEAVPPINHG